MADSATVDNAVKAKPKLKAQLPQVELPAASVERMIAQFDAENEKTSKPQ